MASAQNCSVDYSNVTAIITALGGSLNQTNTLMNQIAFEYLYQGYEQYWQNDSHNNLNIYSNNFSQMAANNTNAILTILKRLMLAVNNQSATSNESLIDLGELITMTNISIIPFSADGTDYATSLANDMNSMLQDILGFIVNLLVNAVQLGNAGLRPTASNIMRILPSSLLAQGLIKRLQNVTNVYIKYMNTSTTNIKNLYNFFKKSQSLLTAWDLMENQTYYNWSLATNVTHASLNSTLINFTKQANTMYKNFVALIPAAIKSNNYISQEAENVMVKLNSNLQDFQDLLVPLFSNIRGRIDTQHDMFTNVIQYIMMYHSRVITDYTMDSTSFNCTATLVNASEALWKTYGGPKNFFNCTTNENGLFPKIQPILQGYLTTLLQDLNATYADFQRCLYIRPILHDGTNYTMEDCLSVVS